MHTFPILLVVIGIVQSCAGQAEPPQADIFNTGSNQAGILIMHALAMQCVNTLLNS